MQRRGDESASDSPRCYLGVVQSCRYLPSALIFGHRIAAWRCSALNVFKVRLIRKSSQTSSRVEDVSSPGRGRETELDLVVDDLRVTLDFGLNLSRIQLGLDWEVVLDIGEDLSIMGLKDVDTVDSDIWGRVMNLCRLVGVDVGFVTYVLGCE